jgi:hypothetical protein
MLPHIRQTSIQEYEGHIDSPLCREILAPSQLKPGDIGSIEKNFPDGKRELVHSFIYLNPRLIFQKRGFEQFAGFSLVNMQEVFKDYPLEHIGTCKRDCSSKITFQELHTDQSFNKTTQAFPSLSLPEPKYFCRTFSEDEPKSIALLNNIIKEDLPEIDTAGLQELQDFFFQGCQRYKELIGQKLASGEFCKSTCPRPRLHYYRCQRPYDYFRKTTSKGANLYKEIQNYIYPLSLSLEKFFLEDKDDLNSLRPQAKIIIQEVSKYLKKKKVEVKKLSHSEKQALALSLIHLTEVISQVGEMDYLERQLPQFVEFSKSFNFNK